MSASIFWYDYETTGIDPRRDRPLQVAGIRTDEALNELGPELNLYCQPSDDILPHPAACLVTGISAQQLQQQGLCEAEFMARLHQEMALPGTCVAGYNNLRFDDEVTRYGLYRNFFDPYAREWQNENSRWDLLDALRTAYALRPEGIVWPEQDGNPLLKLESLTQANGIDHAQAHDALSDVRATIALARLLRERQPRLYQYLYGLRSKQAVLERVRLYQSLLHVSGRFPAARHFLAMVLPLGWHPQNRNALILCDLSADPTPLLELDGESLRRRLYTARQDLAEHELPVPLKLLHVNRCPVLAPLGVLRPQDQERTGLDVQAGQRVAQQLMLHKAVWQPKLATIYAENAHNFTQDPEQQLYQGFISDQDKYLCEQVRRANPAQLAQKQWPFADPRLPELLFRYRARNFPASLSAQEQQQWWNFCRRRLSQTESGAPNTLEHFEAALQALGVTQNSVLDDWLKHAQSLRQRYSL